ncbi:MAG: Spo0B domain-containing protein [Firmicutes bacterium]|nr:Spo0B domain-containing protein [Bacillota bacterium]
MRPTRTESLEFALFCTLFLQLFCGILLFLRGLEHDLEVTIRIILTVQLPIVVLSFLVFGLSRIIARVEEEREKEQFETIQQLERSYQLIQSLEAQQHDFRNHLQVIRTLANMDKSEEIVQYVEECTASLDNLVNMTRVGNVVLQALLLTFQGKLREMGIEFEVLCRADLSQARWSPVKLARIFSNILQNAAEALAQRKDDSPIISVAIWEEEEGVHFVFWNNGPAIPQGDLERIFAPGFSQKVGERRGYGLYIVKTLVNELGGSITVTSSEAEGTEFHVFLPS